ncbi:Golgi to ER traffic protein 4 [Candida viswanathii]|uniref:Golgi to ER traffic protein 4 n=1 Tax=Candida viswanathii TaxID=5486 RepID=A0A367Y3P7_9ASCO|nr:Golgi to ER traffic protein 4 [Candida viswanathii]
MSDKLAKTIQRFQTKIDNGSFYEAHQTLRTITNRYVKAKQYNEAKNLLYQGATILLNNKEYASASDLINYLVQVYTEEGVQIDDKDAKYKLIDLVSNLPNDDPSLVDLSKVSVAWSKLSPECSKFGDPDLHHLFGSKLLKSLQEEGDVDNGSEKGGSEEAVTKAKSPEEKSKIFVVAELHLILGTFKSVPLYVEYLVQCAKANPDVDPGVFLARAVVNYAYLMNIKFVQEAQLLFLNEFGSGDKLNLGVQYYEAYPLLNCLQLLVITLEKDHATNAQKFRKLYDQYNATLKKYELLAPIEYLGRLYFGLNMGNAQGNNMLANIMSGLFK